MTGFLWEITKMVRWSPAGISPQPAPRPHGGSDEWARVQFANRDLAILEEQYA
jgi:hypothetical protein